MPHSLVIPPRTLGTALRRYAYDARLPKGRYRDTKTGRFVPWSTIRSVLDETIANAETSMLAMAERLRAGQINLPEWQRFMEREIKSIHLASYALERGGWQNMTQADFGRVGRLMFNPNATDDTATWGQYQYLRRLAGQIERGEQPLNGKLDQRVRLYTKAGRTTYHRAESLYMEAAGFTEELFVLAPADHCRDEDGPRGGCVERAEAGWAKLGTFGNIGEMNCHSNDRCRKMFRNPATGEIFDPTEA